MYHEKRRRPCGTRKRAVELCIPHRDVHLRLRIEGIRHHADGGQYDNTDTVSQWDDRLEHERQRRRRYEEDCERRTREARK